MSKPIAVSGALVAIFLATGVAQGPMHDKVNVNLPYPVTIRGIVLEPGAYEIRQMTGPTNNRVLHIFRDGGMKLETTVMTIPTLDNKTPEDTKVVLHHIGKDYYFDKIWIQGKDYGYEFVLPDEVKSRMKELSESYSVAATYESTSATTSVTAQAEQKEAEDKAAAERAEQERLAQAERDKQAEADRLAQAERDRLAQAERDRLAQEERDRLAQAERDRLAQEERDRVAQAERDRLAQEERDRLAAAAAKPSTEEAATMPDTADNWLITLAGGLALLSLGLLLRRA